MGMRSELFTTQVTLDNRSYFFNVKENRTGDVFLQVVESKKTNGAESDRHQIAVFSEDMQQFLKGLDESLQFIEKENKERAKARAEKKAAKEAKYGKGGYQGGDDAAPAKKIVRRKGESRLIAQKNAERQSDGLKRTGRVLHVVSKRDSAAPATDESAN